MPFLKAFFWFGEDFSSEPDITRFFCCCCESSFVVHAGTVLQSVPQATHSFFHM
jgi:hypothetical protein